MFKRAETDDQVDAITERANTDQLSTTRLTSGDLNTQAPEAKRDTTNWLVLLTPRSDINEAQADVPPPPQPAPSGMVEHLKPPRMVPTVGSRLTTGLRRTILLSALAVLAVGALAAGAYLVASTTWLSTLFSSPAPVPAQEPATTTIAAGQSQPTAQSQPQPPAQGDTTAVQLMDKGIQQYRAGNFSASIDLLESSINTDGGDAVSYYQLGLVYMAAAGREHALDDAEMAFRTAISLQPTWAAPHQLLAESLLRRGFYKEAIAPANEATKLDPTQPDAWMTLGRAYQGAGQQAEANNAFAEAARHAPPTER